MNARPAAADAIIFSLLLVSISSFMAVPFLSPIGADFQNLYLFHHCAARNNPYLSTGVACGDPWARDMVYPPLLYWSFAWARLFGQVSATVIWMSVVAVGSVAALWPFAPSWRWREDGRLGIFVGLLAAQFPLVFGVERGNNDVVVLLAWAVAAWAWGGGRPALSGVAAGLAVSLKLYPAFAALVVGVAMVAWAIRDPGQRG
jgi:hypothetical protein